MSDARVRVRTEPLGGGPLARLAAADRVPQWYARRPADPREWSARCRAVREGTGHHWLEPLRPGFGPTLARSAAGERLARAATSPAGVVVTTGQQPGLFGGPVYTWSKAVAALALADALEASCGVPVAPVFWAATDDADFEEANATAVALPGGARLLRLARTAPDGTPMSRTPLGADVHAALAGLAEAAGSAASGAVLDVARDAYSAGATVGGAFVALLRAILEPLGVAVLDASHTSVREAGDALLRRALGGATDVDRAVAERAREIAAAGHEPQVPPVAGLSLVFVDGASGEKRRVRLDEAGVVAACAATGTLGPNVLLRPVVERAILPAVAYVGGPGEIAYFAQVGAVASALGAPEPLIVPRWSCTVVEPQIARLLARLGLDVEDLAQPHAAERRLARAAVPVEMSTALADLRAAVGARSAAVRAARDAVGPATLPPSAADGLERALLARLARFERRVTAAQKRASAELMRDVATARGALFPFGVRQERKLNLLPTIARHGQDVLAEMRAAAAAHAASLVGAPSAPAAAPLDGARSGVVAG